MLWDTISETVRATLTTLLLDIPPTAPLLILALSNRPYASLSPEVQVNIDLLINVFYISVLSHFYLHKV